MKRINNQAGRGRNNTYLFGKKGDKKGEGAGKVGEGGEKEEVGGEGGEG